jgi:Cu(I)/Ag(I) efflux system membrane fusion protein
MKRKSFILMLIGLAIAAISVAGGYWFAMRRMHAAPVIPSAKTSSSTASQGPSDTTTTSGRRVLYWHDPMVPGQKFDQPGKSPFMNMELVPVYASETADDGKVTISARTAQNLGVRVVEVKEARMPTNFTTTGAVSVDERSFSAVQARVNGTIEKLHVRAQYDVVARGQPLAEIYSPEWLAAQEEYLVLKRSTRPDTAAIAQAARARLALLGVSEAQIQRVEQTGKSEPRVTLYAPDAGVVWEIGVREGMAVNPGVSLFRLASLSSVWVNAEVPETEAALVRSGTTITARAAALPDAVYKGTVATLLPDVNAATRTIKARIVLTNPGGRLKPGMFVTVAFGGDARPMLTVPAEAVINTGKRSVVIVAEDGGRFHPVDVETGRDSGDMTEIRKGLAAGQKVVASGQFLIDSESSLTTTLSRMQSAPALTPDAAPKSSGGAIKNAQHSANGRIMRIDAKDGTLELSHDPIPALKWPAMTMMFRAADKSVLAHAKTGDDIEFDMLAEPNKDGDYVITRIAPRKPKAAK